MAVSPSTDSPSIDPGMSIVAYASSMSGSSESVRSAKRSRSASTCSSIVFVVDRLDRQLDAQLVVTDEVHLRAHLDDGVELDVALVLAGGDLDLRRRDHVDVVLGDRVDVELGQRVAQRLLARDLGAEARFEQPARRLARTESRDPHLARQLAERGVDRLLELVGRHGDVELDLRQRRWALAADGLIGVLVDCRVVARRRRLHSALHKDGGV